MYIETQIEMVQVKFYENYFWKVSIYDSRSKTCYEETLLKFVIKS